MRIALVRSGMAVSVPLLLAIAACGPVAAAGSADAAAAASDGATEAATAVRPVAAKRPASAAPRAGSGPTCPSMLTPSTAVPHGARRLGTAAAGPLALSWAVVTMNAPETIADDLDGMAEVEPEEGPARAGVLVELYAAAPTPALPHTLVCRYGRARRPLLAEAALLLPFPARGHYTCTVERPVGKTLRPGRAICSPDPL